jgi:hypothetical protein
MPAFLQLPFGLSDIPLTLGSPENYTDYLIIALVFLSGIVSVLLIYILISLIFKNRRESVEAKWRNIISILIQTCLFSDEDEHPFSISAGIHKLLKKKAFRLVLTRELVEARKSFSGGAGENLLTLYKRLNLQEVTLEKLRSKHWYIKAQGIQELAHMNQKDKLDKIYKLADDKNELVRMEAQLAVVQLSGFEGLKFLDNLSYHLSDWQQVKLLSELRGAHQSSSASVEGWLKSTFSTVVLFSLKLIAVYQHFELYASVIRCLSHVESKVRLQAILTLKEIYTDETASELISIYQAEGLHNKLKILNVLMQIGTREILPFLFTEMQNENNQVKMEAARAVSAIGTHTTLHSFPEAQIYPWNQIIRQIEQELAA